MISKIFAVVVEAGLVGLDAAETATRAGKKVIVSGYGKLSGVINPLYHELTSSEPEQHQQQVSQHHEQVPDDTDKSSDIARESQFKQEDGESITGTAEAPAERRPSFHAPPITLTAAGTRQNIRLDAIGKPAVLLFHGKDNSKTAEAINVALQRKYYPEAPALVANIIWLRGVPRMFHDYAQSKLEQTYRRVMARYVGSLPAAAIIDAAGNAVDAPHAGNFIFILPDWDGSAAAAFGLRDVSTTMGLVVLDKEGEVVGTYQGDDPEMATLNLLNKL